MATKKEEIDEAKIRQAIWYLNHGGKTKKFVCEHLGINYNTTRLDKIIQDFRDKTARIEELKSAARAAILTDDQEKDICQSYLNGDAISKIADQLYLTSPRVKAVLIKRQIPLRSRKKSEPAKTEHISQDLEIKFSIGDRVFVPKNSSYAIVKEVYDEDYIHTLEDGYSKFVELSSFKNLKEDQEPRLGVHYETYWHLSNGKVWGKTAALQEHLAKINSYIIETGREYYLVYVSKKDETGTSDGYWRYCKRADLFPVVIK